MRRVQWQKAIAGDKTMMIWMGKQHLGQSDRQDVKQDVSAKVTVDEQRASMRKLLSDEDTLLALRVLADKLDS